MSKQELSKKCRQFLDKMKNGVFNSKTRNELWCLYRDFTEQPNVPKIPNCNRKARAMYRALEMLVVRYEKEQSEQND